jgi:methylated-DNA-[protein]-cysteine S-methyltransferase
MIRTSTKAHKIQKATMAASDTLQRKRAVADIAADVAHKKTSPSAITKPRRTSSSSSSRPDMSTQLRRIAACDRTEFEKRVWTALCQVPAGRVSTYGMLAAYLGSAPRAVGGALRRNPFAPEVPCHRIVATGGTLGGFKGHPSNRKTGEGITMDEKKALLRGEGVRIDGQGRVLGTPWSGFV